MVVARGFRGLAWVILLAFVLASFGCGANLGPKAKIKTVRSTSRNTTCG